MIIWLKSFLADATLFQLVKQTSGEERTSQVHSNSCSVTFRITFFLVFSSTKRTKSRSSWITWRGPPNASALRHNGAPRGGDPDSHLCPLQMQIERVMIFTIQSTTPGAWLTYCISVALLFRKTEGWCNLSEKRWPPVTLRRWWDEILERMCCSCRSE